MTKEITKAFVLQEIQDKFKLRELMPEKFTFSEMVIPTYNVNPHLVKREIDSVDTVVTSTGNKLLFTVPEDERWTLRGYLLLFVGVSTVTVAGVYLQRGSVTTDYIYLDLAAAQNVSYIVNLYALTVCDPGDKIYVNVDGYTSSMTLRCNLDVTKEEIR